MAKPAIVNPKPAMMNPLLPRAALAGAAALLLLCSPIAIGTATAKVGVTSATDGDPLGKPPTEAERVLRVGIDVQANEAITTKAGDRAHLVFLDGTSLTVGPDASVVIDKFVYDPQTKTGDLAITASKGVFRLVGGKISKTNAIVVNTPSDTIGIRGGIAMLDVNQAKTRSIFIFGFSMTVGANGRIETITRPGTEVTTSFGGLPGRPALLTRGQLTALLILFEGSKKGGTQGGGNADQTAKNSGFSDKNSSKGTGVDGSKDNKFGSGPGPRNRNPNDVFVNAITQSNSIAPSQQSQPDTTNVTTISNTMTSKVTYVGTMSGLVINNGRASAANGIYQNVWNVGARNGVASATFNGATYGGGSAPNTFAVGNSPAFVTTAPLPSTSGPAGRNLSLVGVTSPNAQVGAFTITGPRYGAVGTFQGTAGR
jgi:hypothetical protein